MAAWYEATFSRISAALSLRDIKRSRRGGPPSTYFECELDGGQLPRLLCEVGVNSAHLQGVEGRKRRPREQEEQLEWYAVLARFAIQIEDQTSGMQTYEDRIVLVRATDFEDAERRLESEFAAYGHPYFNSEWELVRWHFERVLDVYETNIDTLDPTGTEVFSTLRSRRMRPEFEWHPRDELDGATRDWRMRL